jgi:hypothetical protein
MNHYRSHLFWGADAPLSTLTGAGLLIVASVRTAYALICLGALLWIYVLTALTARLAKPVLPLRGKPVVLVFLASLFGSFFLLFMFLVNPILAAESVLIVLLAQVTCIGSDLCRRSDFPDPMDVLARAFLEALVLGILVIALALIREPLGFGSLSVPGGAGGIITVINGEGLFFPIRLVSASSGALILLGYGLAVFRRRSPSEDTE